MKTGALRLLKKTELAISLCNICIWFSKVYGSA
jgi:hypothetical protein